ncbi:MAG TPA: hypothetical protein VGQ36_10690 [Thermoanaerobaculia bacterium]|jgi:hypothetical protein|nr:hypothetical protein [Thermoanaerobaculia bacterium]
MKGLKATLFVRLGLAAFASLLSVAAIAGQGGEGIVSAPRIFNRAFHLPAGTKIQFSTHSLSSGSDTVIHVQNRDDPNGGFVAGNDNCATGVLHSCVTVAATGTPRNLVVLVRADNSSRGGTATLRTVIDGGIPSDEAIDFGVAVIGLGSLLATSHVFTTRLLGTGAASDSILLLVSGVDGGNAIAFDDDDGIERMSWLHNDVACAACKIVVGSYSTGTAGQVKVVWDEDIHTSDADADGLGAGLEAALGSSSSTADADGDSLPDGRDTDKDGIDDGLEVIGVDASGDNPAVLFPTWGARPTRQDVFVEMDWTSGHMPTPAFANAFTHFLARDDANPEIALHLDIGVNNTAAVGDPSLTRWGNWGGATYRDSQDFCDGFTAVRKANHFHHGSLGDGLQGKPADPCFKCNVHAGICAQELGHNFGTDHGGQRGSGVANNKAIYPSPMNYLYTWNSKITLYSTGSFMGVQFNPNAIDEYWWRQSNTTSDLSLLQDIGYTVSGNAVDWNRDGHFAPLTRAPVNLSDIGRARDNGFAAGGLGSGENGPTLTWYQTAMPTFYMFTRRTSDGIPLYRTTTDVESACTASTTDIVPPCATWTPAAPVPMAVAASKAAGAADFRQGGVQKLMIVYPNMATALQFQILTGSTWSAPAAVGGTADGDPAVFYDSRVRRVEVFAPSGGNLKRWSYSLATSSWDVVGVDQQWAGGAVITPWCGIAVTLGWKYGPPWEWELFAAIPTGSTTKDPYGTIQFAKRSATANEWTKLKGPDMGTIARPGLAYEPFDKATDLSTGRFYILAVAGNRVPKWSMSQGNDESPSAPYRREYVWEPPRNYYNDFDKVQAGSGVTLSWTRNRDSNVRGAFGSTAWNNIFFQPLADGLVNFNFTDQNDYAIMKKNLRCSWLPSQCFRCLELNADGTCLTWGPGTSP